MTIEAPDLAARVEALTVELVKIPSINGTEGEAKIARYIKNYLAQNPYFQEHPQFLLEQPLVNDHLGRMNVLALVKGEKAASPRTVIIHGHIDTVGVDDFGSLKPYAFSPYELADKLREANIPAEVRTDLESGEWLFGRGCNDMKAGVAVNLCVLEEFIKERHNHSGNLLFMVNPVEENQHTGIMEALHALKNLEAEHGLEYVVAVNQDFTAPMFAGDGKHYFYLGAIGKLLPCFYVVGKEAHVGQCFSGFDPSLVAAEITRGLDLNTQYCDRIDGEVTLPPTVLHMRELKPEYNVQTPREAFVYANYFTYETATKDVLAKMKELAAEAMERVITYMEGEHETYCRQAGLGYRPAGWQPKVLTFAELKARIRELKGKELDQELLTKTREMMAAGKDLRVICLSLVRDLKEQDPDHDPCVIVFFAPPYCPRNRLHREIPAEAEVIAVLEQLVNEHREKTGQEITINNYFPLLSDSSYMKMDDDDHSVAALIDNLPGWHYVYPVPVAEIRQRDLPAINLGTYGKDGHKYTERVLKSYTFDTLPRLTLRFLELILNARN
jgi:arginine utilization protein RocB